MTASGAGAARPTRIDAVVGLGANLGDPRATFEAAIAALDATEGVTVRARSSLYRTAPVGPPQPEYRNAALRLDAELQPEPLLDVLLAIERAHGRDRALEARWGPRTLDLDLLYVFGRRVASARLTVPHPELTKRAFALAPLLDVAPELVGEFGTVLADLGGRPPVERW
jgi:2-amino-4-hydroxy-6-hydroxymethyldihydropteridine diphosphokinase